MLGYFHRSSDDSFGRKKAQIADALIDVSGFEGGSENETAKWTCTYPLVANPESLEVTLATLKEIYEGNGEIGQNIVN